jgi:hypothetical protein
VDETGSETCPVADSGVSDIESPDYATALSVTYSFQIYAYFVRSVCVLNIMNMTITRKFELMSEAF